MRPSGKRTWRVVIARSVLLGPVPIDQSICGLLPAPSNKEIKTSGARSTVLGLYCATPHGVKTLSHSGHKLDHNTLMCTEMGCSDHQLVNVSLKLWCTPPLVFMFRACHRMGSMGLRRSRRWSKLDQMILPLPRTTWHGRLNYFIMMTVFTSCYNVRSKED